MKTFTHKKITSQLSYEIKDQTKNGFRVYNITKPDNTLLSYPSITTILGQQDKDWLNKWQAALGKDKAAKEKARCSKRGQLIHDNVELYLKNKPIEELPTLERKLFNQIKPKLNRIDNIYTQEEALFSEQFKIAGRVDCIGEYDGNLSIIDFKTSTSVKTQEMIQDYYLQCTAYSIMFYELYNILIPQIVIIMCVEKGIVPLVFKREVEDYILPLTQRINSYYKAR